MKTKTFLTVIGLVTSQSLFYSCSDDNDSNVNMETENNQSKNLVSTNSFNGANVNADIFNHSVSFIKSKVGSQGASYVLTQSDLNQFYQIAQIPTAQRLSLDKVNSIISQTANMAQLPFDQILEQLGYSDMAKDLAMAISNNYMPDLQHNPGFQNLATNERQFIESLNDLRFNYEQGLLNTNVFSKDGGPFIGGAIGMGVGFMVAGPIGAFVGGTVGWFVGGYLESK